MRYLLDTHSFLWALFSPEKLSRSVRDTIKDRDNEIAISVISLWEISLKYALGKLELHNSDPEDMPGAALEMGIDLITVDPKEAASFHNLQRLPHKDPFDRFLVWQAIQGNMILISKDRSLRDYCRYGLRIHW